MGEKGDGDRLADLGGPVGPTGLRIAPGCYAAGEGVLDDIYAYLRTEDGPSDAVILAGETAFSAVGGAVERSFEERGVEYTVLTFEGECSPDRVADYRDALPAEAPDLLVGIGGGKALDAAKLVAEGNCPVATVPTVASTCAAWTPHSIVYEPDGSYLGPVRLSRCPEWVLVDTGVIAESPPRLLASGIMDATAKHFETARIPSYSGGVPARWGTSIARECYSSCLRDDAREALDACERNELDGTLEAVIESCIAGPGLAAGLLGEQPHLLLGHLLCYSLLDYDGVRERSYHGERVAYGVLVFQLLAGEDRDAVSELKAWYEGLGTDLSLETLGPTGVDERTVADLAGKIDERADDDLIRTDLSPGDVRDAIATVESL